MTHSAALPFELRRSQDVVAATEITSTRETIHGLLRLDGDRLIVQWRVARSTDRVGAEIRTDHEMEPVREVTLPLSALAAARVRRVWWQWPPGSRIVLTAADLRAFEEIAGGSGLRLSHPAELSLPIRRADRLAALEFASELELAMAERALAAAQDRPTLASGDGQVAGARRLPDHRDG